MREFLGSSKVDRSARVSLLNDGMKALGVKAGEPLLVYVDRSKKEIIIKRAEEK